MKIVLTPGLPLADQTCIAHLANEFFPMNVMVSCEFTPAIPLETQVAR